jgi:peptidoglycan hydrolase CwlO-like protein
MKSLIQIIVSAVAFIAGLKSNLTNLVNENQILRDQLASQQTVIADLKDKLAADTLDDAALEAAAADAQKLALDANERATQLQSEIDEANKAADGLAAALTEHDNTPSVDPVTFAVLEEGDPVVETAPPA